MGKFLDTTYTATINSILDSEVKRLDNTFYTFTDKAPTTCTYYNLNTSHSTLDEASNLAYSYTDGDSPLRYNRIKDTVLYGIDRIQVQLEAGDFGIESDSIEGDAYIIPNAFKPYPQDYFIINHTNEEYLFKVTNVSLDTLPTGANMYKISYKLSSHDGDNTDIDALVVESYTMDTTNIGTNLSLVIKDDDYSYIAKLEQICTDMMTYYRSLFYSDKVQTFIFSYDDHNFYDSYMVEFIKRNDLMNTSELPFLQVSHQLATKSTFALDYSRSFFHSLERKDIGTICNPSCYGMKIEDKTSIMYYNLEDYYYIFHEYRMGDYWQVPSIDDDTVMRIRDNERYETDDLYYFKNIIIDYFNNNTDKMNRYEEFLIKHLEDFNYTIPANVIFYYVPVIIFILQDQIKTILKNVSR